MVDRRVGHAPVRLAPIKLQQSQSV